MGHKSPSDICAGCWWEGLGNTTREGTVGGVVQGHSLSERVKRELPWGGSVRAGAREAARSAGGCPGRGCGEGAGAGEVAEPHAPLVQPAASAQPQVSSEALDC